MYGEYRFALAPNEQKVWKGFFKEAFVKVFNNRIRYQWPYYLPLCVATYALYIYAKKENERFNRKNPADYADEE